MNRYGLDTSYFEDLIKREFGDLSNYTPSEFARVCARMAASADSSVFDEPEFSPASRCDLVMDEPEPAEKVERLTMVIGGRQGSRAAAKAAEALLMFGSSLAANVHKPDIFEAFVQKALVMKKNKINEIHKKERIRLESAINHKKISDALSPNWVQINDNQTFIQRKMQGKRRIY